MRKRHDATEEFIVVKTTFSVISGSILNFIEFHFKLYLCRNIEPMNNNNYFKHIVGANLNKRAQVALGRSPEEKVKGHSGAIYRGPVMLSTLYW